MAPNQVRKRKILVVEPDPELSQLLKDFLVAQRFEVEMALQGDEALKRVQVFAPDIILLSRELPKNGSALSPDGLRVLKVLKQDRNSRVPVILSSAEVTEDDFDRYRKLKFTAEDYIKKPFEDTEILRRIENLVGFDLSDEMERIKARLETDKLGLETSESTRHELHQLLEQVGKELDRQERELGGEEAEGAKPSAEIEPAPAAGTQGLKKQNRDLLRQLDKLQKQLKNERKRNREIKTEWEAKLTKIASELEESGKRETSLRDEFEIMRQKYADLELDHTIQLDLIQAEKRRLEEDLAMLKEAVQQRNNERYLPELKDLFSNLGKIIATIEDEDES